MSIDSSFRLKPGTVIRCDTYTERAPILSIWRENCALALYLSAGPVTAADVAVAREFAAAAQAWLAEAERLHAARTARAAVAS